MKSQVTKFKVTNEIIRSLAKHLLSQSFILNFEY